MVFVFKKPPNHYSFLDFQRDCVKQGLSTEEVEDFLREHIGQEKKDKSFYREYLPTYYKLKQKLTSQS